MLQVKVHMRWTVAYVLLAERHQVRTMNPLALPKEEAVPFKVSINWTHLDFPSFQAYEVKGTTRRSLAGFFSNLKAHDTLS
jgi:hypothetical protein